MELILIIRTEIELNTDASYKMAKLHDALKENGYMGHELEVYLVRLLFCLFADDTGVFEKSSFYNYLKASNPDGSDLSGRLTLLFSTLDTPDDKRMKNLPDELKRFDTSTATCSANVWLRPSFPRKCVRPCWNAVILTGPKSVRLSLELCSRGS